jgi:hypothetical protein
MTHVWESSFLKNLQTIILLVNLVVMSLMYFMTIPQFPLFVPNYTFTISAISVSHDLFSMYSSGCMPIGGNPVILEIRETPMGTGLSIHRIPPCTLAKSCLTHSPTFLLRPKCGISSRLMIPKLYSSIIHYVGSKMAIPRGLISLMSSKCISCARSRNFFASLTSWSTYLSFDTFPNISSTITTTSGM